MNKTARTALSVIILLAAFFPAAAQHRESPRTQWFSEMRQLRTNYVVKELKLTDEQRERFVPVYDEMSREVMKVMTDTRKMYKSIKEKGSAATELEKEKAAEALYECKGKENAIEMRYFSKFKTILTPDQLLQLKKAEQRFSRQLMKHKGKGKKKQ